MINEKKNAWINVILISAVVLILTIADFCVKDRVFSETENRTLEQKPKFSVESLFKGDYTSKYETYVTDQFVCRDTWIAVKTGMDILLQKKEIGGVYLSADGYLIEQHLPEEYDGEKIEKKLSLLKNLTDKWGAKVMLAPTADNILTEKLPAYALYFDEKAFLDQVKNRVGAEHFIDVYAALNAHKTEDIYYRTDHHWTSLGAYYGYVAWAEAMGVEAYPYKEMTAVTEEFLGTLHSKVNIPWDSEKICIFEETTRQPVTVTYDRQKVTDTLYEEKHLKTKNKYGYFLDDNHALIEIETENHTGRTVVVIKDSYANCLVPLLLPHYDKICVLDLRYYKGRLNELLTQYGQPGEIDVLVLYNCIHFLDEFAYVE